MKIGVIAESPLERAVMAVGLVPTPMLDSFAMIGARALIVVAKLGVFEALGSGALGASEVAAKLGTHPEVTRKLLNLLVTQGHLRLERGRYALSASGRRWLLPSSPPGSSALESRVFESS